MMAAYGGSEDVVRYLLGAGADVTMKTTQQYDAARWARLKNHNALADQLDALSSRVLAQRQVQRGGAAPAGDGRQAGSASAAPAAANPASSGQALAANAQKRQSDNSTSRYFDLDRFDEEPSP